MKRTGKEELGEAMNQYNITAEESTCTFNIY